MAGLWGDAHPFLRGDAFSRLCQAIRIQLRDGIFSPAGFLQVPTLKLLLVCLSGLFLFRFLKMTLSRCVVFRVARIVGMMVRGGIR